MKIDLNGRAAVVTGAGRGIGASISHTLARAGARVVVVDRDRERAKQVAEAISASGGSARAEVSDVAKEADVDQLFRGVADWNGACDILVNNAGISRPGATDQVSRDEWDRVLAVNLTGAFLCSRHVMGAMKERGWGRIVNIASFNAKSAPVYGDNASYAASKAGLVGLTHNLAMELAPHGITANAVAPGVVDTDLVRVAHSEERRADLLARIPIGRYTNPDEVASLVAFLASEYAASITGETVNINGGLYMD
jgi:3-oxoacyl-[acyl-carrier protein] reductase